MASGNQLSVKVFNLREDNETKETRRFTVDADVCGSFEYMIAKIRNLFPELSQKPLHLLWKDDEGDYVTISSDEELEQAIQEMSVGSSYLKLFLKVKEEKSRKSCDRARNDGCQGKPSPSQQYRRPHESMWRDHFLSTQQHPLLGGNPFCRRRTHCIRRNPGLSAWGNHTHPDFPFPHFVEHIASLKPRREESEEESFQSLLSEAFGIPSDLFSVFKNECSAKKKEDKEKSQQPSSDKELEEKLTTRVKEVMTRFGLNPESLKISVESLPGDDDNESESSDGKTLTGLRVKAEFSNEEAKEDQVTNGEGPPFNEQEDTPTASQKDTPNTTQDEKHATDETSKSKDESINDDQPESQASNEPSTPNDDNESQIQNPLDQLIKNFSEELGMGSEQPPQAFGELLQKLFQPLNHADKPNGEEFVFVDKEKEEDKEKTLSKEERYQQRLEKALCQMEAMGFDNDGGWLKQLLISKDLSVERVLDALNPQ